MKIDILDTQLCGLDSLAQARPRISQVLRQIIPSQAAMLEVAVNEAVNNAFRHGSIGRVSLKMRVINGRLLVMRVRDDGPGFDVSRILCFDRQTIQIGIIGVSRKSSTPFTPGVF